MKNASFKDKKLVVDILTQSFEANKSVNYIVKQDSRRRKRIKALMKYSFHVCYLFGDVFLSDDHKACALVLYPEKKKTTLKSLWLDAKLAITCVGLNNIKKTLEHTARIKNTQPQKSMYYIWFIGVNPIYQNKGIGSKLLSEIITDSQSKNRSVYLETSTYKNISWYEKFDFHIYHELDMGYNLFFLSNE